MHFSMKNAQLKVKQLKELDTAKSKLPTSATLDELDDKTEKEVKPVEAKAEA